MIDDQNWKSKECDNHGARTTQLRSGRGYHAISIRLRDELEKIWMLWARYLTISDTGIPSSFFALDKEEWLFPIDFYLGGMFNL